MISPYALTGQDGVKREQQKNKKGKKTKKKTFKKKEEIKTQTQRPTCS